MDNELLINGKVNWEYWETTLGPQMKRNPYHEQPPVMFYTNAAWNYVEDVVSGRLDAPYLIKLACQRTLDDYERSLTDDPKFPYVYDPYKVFHKCWFMENLVHVEGPLGGEYFQLERWQIWVESQEYGWVYKEGHEKAGYRRFRTDFEEMPRGQGKSFKASGDGIYMEAADSERGAQVVSAATSQKQARVILDAARQIAMEPKCSKLMKKIGISVQAHGIFAKKKFARFIALTAQGNRLDGLNIHCALIDEIHAHPTRILYDVLVTGAKKRKQSKILIITTAGTDIGGIGYEVHSYATKVLTGEIKDETFFAAIWTLDEGTSTIDEEGNRIETPGDDWTDPKVWEKCNPNWWVSIDRESYEAEAIKAQHVPTARANFLTKHLNVWCKDNMVCPFDTESAKAQPVYDPTIDWESEKFLGKPCFAAIDLGSVSDMTALTLIFPMYDPVTDEYTMYSMNKFYLPRKAVQESRISQYKGWEYEKLITVTEGNATDYNRLRKDLEILQAKYNIMAVAYDGWNAAELVAKLTEDGVNLFQMQQTVANLSPSTKELDRYIRLKRFKYDNKVLLWMMGNTVVTIDTNGNIKPKKETGWSPMKIDGIITNAMCFMMMINAGVYETPAELQIVQVGNPYNYDNKDGNKPKSTK